MRAHQRKRECCCEEPFCGHPELPKKSFELRVVFKLVNHGSASHRTKDRTGIGQGFDQRQACLGQLPNLGSCNPYVQRASCTIKEGIARGLLRAIKSTYVPWPKTEFKVEICFQARDSRSMLSMRVAYRPGTGGLCPTQNSFCPLCGVARYSGRRIHIAARPHIHRW